MRTRTAARHSSDSPEWFTPRPLVEAAREVLGGIDLDPASHAEANKIIQAGRIYDERANGLRRPWSGRVFLNPPGGLVAEFWHRLIDAWDGRDGQKITAAIWIGFSIEQLQTLQGYDVRSPLAFPLCIPERRIPFVESSAKRELRRQALEEENRGRRREGLELKKWKEAAAPSHANYVTYIGRAPARFAKVFGTFGEVRR